MLEIIPYMAGGLIISSVILLNYRYGKKLDVETSSIYSLITGSFSMKWKSTFVAGMLFVATLSWSLFGPGLFFESDKEFFKGTGLIQFMISGFLIGLGTKLAAGGLNRFALFGVPRFNSRSLISMGIVLLFGIFTATLRSEFPFLKGLNLTKPFNEHFDFRLSFLIPLSILLYNLIRNYNYSSVVREILSSFGMGCLLAFGMMLAGFTKRHLVINFLSFTSGWNSFLIFVFLGAILGNIFLWNVIAPGLAVNVTTEPEDRKSLRTILGCSLFGSGIGISGLLPGSGLLVAPVYLPQIALFFLPFIALGQFTVDYVDRNILKTPKTLNVESSRQERIQKIK
jgi:hypothetical protein